MRKNIIALGVFLYASVLIWVFGYFSLPPIFMLQITGIITLIMIGALYVLHQTHVKVDVLRQGRWIFLFLANLLTQLIIIITGGLYSPFFVLYHLGGITISLLFTPSIALLFILTSLMNMLLSVYFMPHIMQELLQDPVTIVLYLLSFLSIAPIGYLLAQRYHLKDTLFSYMANKVQVEESILADLQELVFVIDTETKILSLNDAVERTLRRSRSELFHQPLFEVVFIKDTNGTLVDNKLVQLEEIMHKNEMKTYSDLLLLTTGSPLRKVMMRITPIHRIEGNISQCSVIITAQQTSQTSEKTHKLLDEIQLQHEAYAEDMKKRLQAQGLTDLAARMVLLAKTEKDMITTRVLEDHGITEQKVMIDLARLVRETTDMEQEFADIAHVLLTFNLANFTKEDIAPLVTNVFSISPEQFTGPFFTTACDVKYVGLLIQKLIEVAVLLAASQKNPIIGVSVERLEQDIQIKISGPCPALTPDEQEAIFIQQYGELRTKAQMYTGSGLEGYMAKSISTYLNIPLSVTISDMPSSTCTFTVRIPKQKQPSPTSSTPQKAK